MAVIEQELARARIEASRVERLVERQLVAASEVEDRKLDLTAAAARLEKARRDAAVIDTDLTYTVIHAPITGTGNSTANTTAVRPPRSTATVASASSIGTMAWP